MEQIWVLIMRSEHVIWIQQVWHHLKSGPMLTLSLTLSEDVRKSRIHMEEGDVASRLSTGQTIIRVIKLLTVIWLFSLFRAEKSQTWRRNLPSHYTWWISMTLCTSLYSEVREKLRQLNLDSQWTSGGTTSPWTASKSAKLFELVPYLYPYSAGDATYQPKLRLQLWLTCRTAIWRQL